MERSICLLGAFRVRREDKVLTFQFRTAKERALLAYVVMEGHRYITREALAELLWPENEPGLARVSLRQALVGARKAVGDREDEEPFFDVDASSIRINPRCEYRLDVQEFTKNLQAVQAHQHAETVCLACVRRLERMVSLYRGDFLADVIVPGSLAFQEWAIYHREQYYHNLLNALLELSDYYISEEEYETAYKHAWRIVNMAPLEESGYRRLMWVLAKSGKRSAALEQYRACREELERELGVEPTDETTRLYHQIQIGDLGVDFLKKTGPVHVLKIPAPASGMIGREHELSWLVERLHWTSPRVVLLTGMAGVGKTRLALEAASCMQEEFPDGVFYISLEEVEEPHDLLVAVQKEVGLPDDNQLLPRLQISEYFRDRNALLILDHFDSVSGELGFIVQLMQATSRLKVVVTCQRGLSLQNIEALHLRGLAYPTDLTVENAASYPAVRLFIERASRSRPGLDVPSMDMRSIVEICKIVDGLPLALELAASSLRRHSIRQVASGLHENINFLVSELEDIDNRQRSICNTFLDVWSHLESQHRSSVRRLAIFEGAFSDAAALAVAGVASSTLHALAGCSLIEQETPYRYRMNPLFQRFASSKLLENVEELEELEQSHTEYYVERLNGYLDGCDKPECINSIETLLSEQAEVRRVFDWLQETKEEEREKLANKWQRYKRSTLDGDVPGSSLFTSATREALDAVLGGNSRGSLHISLTSGDYCCGHDWRLEDSLDAMLVLDSEGKFVDANYSSSQVTGYTRTQLVEKYLSDLVDDQALETSLEGRLIPIVFRRSDKIRVPVNAAFAPFTSQGQPYQLLVLRMPKEREEHHTNLINQNPDPLTGLPNLSNFKQIMRRSISLSSRQKLSIGVLILRVKGLREINRDLGNEAGDEVLLRLSKELPRRVRETDVVARVGGNEFAVLLSLLSLPQDVTLVERKLDKALTQVLQSFPDPAPRVLVGAAVYPKDGVTPEDLIKYANFEAKEPRPVVGGGGCC